MEARASRALSVAITIAHVSVCLLLHLALGSFSDAGVILAMLPVAFVGGIFALLITAETWNVSSLVGLIGLFGIAVQNGLVLVTQTRSLLEDGKMFEDAVKEASIGRVRPKIMTASTAILGLLPLLVVRLHGTEIERPLAIVMVGGLVTSRFLLSWRCQRSISSCTGSRGSFEGCKSWPTAPEVRSGPL